MMMFRLPTALFFFALGASAAPGVQVAVQPITKRDVWAPPITDLTAQTVWYLGDTVTVEWDTSDPPEEVTNPIGRILLGYFLPNGTGGENLDVDNPLAQNFPLTDGEVSFDVPTSITPGCNYIIALFGDSGNISPEFCIEDPSTY